MNEGATQQTKAKAMQVMNKYNEWKIEIPRVENVNVTTVRIGHLSQRV